MDLTRISTVLCYSPCSHRLLVTRTIAEVVNGHVKEEQWSYDLGVQNGILFQTIFKETFPSLVTRDIKE